MATNLKLAFRNLLRSKLYTTINIVGLSLGLTCAIIITVWVKNELSYDKHLPNADRLYRLTFETNWGGGRGHFARCWEKWVTQIPANFPDVEELVRMAPDRHTAIKAGNVKVEVDQYFFADSNIFNAFGMQLITGNSANILNQPNIIVLSETLAHKIYGNTNPVGQILMVSGDSVMKATTVKGVFKDWPANSHFHPEALQSFYNPKDNPDWAYIYIKLHKGAKPEDILKGMPAFIRKFESEESAANFKPFLQKVTDIHLYSNKDREIEPNGNITGIYLFILVALIVLLVAWVNYYNLNNVRVIKLTKQVFVQAINGSGYWRIALQSIAESTICTAIAILFSMVFSELFNQYFSQIIGLTLLPNGLTDILSILPFVTAMLVITVIAGCLPFLLHLVRLQRVGLQIASKSKVSGSRLFSSRGFLIIAQFILAIVLMFSASVIFRQKQYILDHSLGKMNDDIIMISNANWETRKLYDLYRQKAMESPLIKDFTSAMEEPSGETMDRMPFVTQGVKDESLHNSIFILPVEDSFFNFFNLEMVAGRTFATYNPKSAYQDYVLNETAVKMMGWMPEEAIGKPFRITFTPPEFFLGGTIVGVVRDFHYNSLKQQIKPYVFTQQRIFQTYYLVKVDTAKHTQALTFLNNLWNEIAPDYPFEFEYLSNTYRKTYHKELVQTRLTGLFTLFAILIVCMGLFAVTSIIIAQRTKEIGIRKVNGASIAEMIRLLLTDVVIWIAIACLIALPIAYYLMNSWLQNFAYKTTIDWQIFAMAAAVAFIIGIATVMWQAWRAASKNPVEALRYE